jgi:hypothetical protein
MENKKVRNSIFGEDQKLASQTNQFEEKNNFL